jgi:hypothetical protein
VGIGEFQIPPNEINDILPQQLLALKVGAGALTDAGLPLREPRERMGVVFGIGFDFEATNFHLRWQLFTKSGAGTSARPEPGRNRSMDQWLESLRDQCGPPLTPPRVMGALGGIVASRMAREFRFGGPSFVVSADAASGFKALRVAVDLLQENAADAMLVGAVDLAGEGRNVVRMNHWLPFSRTNRRSVPSIPMPTVRFPAKVRWPWCSNPGRRPRSTAIGFMPSSGHRQRRRRRSGKGRVEAIDLLPLIVHVSADRCPVDSVSYVETHGAGVPDQDRMEIKPLVPTFSPNAAQADPSMAIALGSTKPISRVRGRCRRPGIPGQNRTCACTIARCHPLSGLPGRRVIGQNGRRPESVSHAGSGATLVSGSGTRSPNRLLRIDHHGRQLQPCAASGI